MEKPQGALIREVLPQSIASELELEPGDRLLRINGQKIDDFIRFLTLSAEEELTLEVLKKSGEIEDIDFEKDPDEPLGLAFEGLIYDRIRTCKNNCLFCFVHQLPAGQRKTLYIKDDDYRLSFLQGCYITLTNLTEKDWTRIETLKLSPLYVSVHATDPEIRSRLLGFKNGGNIISQLKRLTRAGITVHTQAVLCPGINDGQVLGKTITDLAALYPGVATLAVVPVGLTAHRQHLYPLDSFTPETAQDVLEIVHTFQSKFLGSLGSRFVFAADEWYLRAGVPFPESGAYEGYPQLDNGVGLIQWFREDFEQSFKAALPVLQTINTKLVIITGKSAVQLWTGIQSRFTEAAPGIQLTILPVTNRFFGESITVTGLLVGRDIASAIREFDGPETRFIIPQITLKQDEAVFLDGMTLQQLIKDCSPKQINVVPTKASDWLEWIIKEGSETV